MRGDWLSRSFHGMFLSLFGVVFLYILMGKEEPLLLSAFTALAFLLLLAAYRFAAGRTVTEEGVNRATFFILAAMAVGMALMGWNLLPKLKTDLGMVYYSAMEILRNGRVNDEPSIHNEITTITNMTNNEYFVVYPNNLPILFVLTGFYRVVCALGISMDSEIGIYMAVLLNLTVILTAVFVGSRTAKRLFGNRAALFFLVLAAIFVPYYINVSRFYTDTLTLPFPILSIYLFLRLRERLRKQGKGEDASEKGLRCFRTVLALAILLGVCLAAGFLLKGSCLITAAALAIYSCLEVLNGNIKIKGLAVSALAVALCLGCVVGGWNRYVRSCGWIDMEREEELTFPMAHWVMMALSGTGGYNREDFDYTFSYPGKKAKAEADWKRAKEKIEGYGGACGLLDFEFRKLASTWGDGKYAQQIHLTWNQKRTAIQEFTRTDGRYYEIFDRCTTVSVLVMYLCFLLSAGRGIREKNGPRTLIHLCIFGVLLFFAFWETKSRYLLNFTPVFFLCTLYGLEDSLPEKRKKTFMRSKICDRYLFGGR